MMAIARFRPAVAVWSGLAVMGAVLCSTSLPARAFGGTGSVMGRIVLPRADAPSVSSTRSARSQYVLHCAGCHGTDGAGSVSGDVPDLRRIGRFLALDGGRSYVVKVPGVMASGLDDAQVAGVVNWVLATLARDTAPTGQPPYDAAEIASARGRPLVDVAAERHRLLKQAQERGIELY